MSMFEANLQCILLLLLFLPFFFFFLLLILLLLLFLLLLVILLLLPLLPLLLLLLLPVFLHFFRVFSKHCFSISLLPPNTTSLLLLNYIWLVFFSVFISLNAFIVYKMNQPFVIFAKDFQFPWHSQLSHLCRFLSSIYFFRFPLLSF